MTKIVFFVGFFLQLFRGFLHMEGWEKSPRCCGHGHTEKMFNNIILPFFSAKDLSVLVSYVAIGFYYE